MFAALLREMPLDLANEGPSGTPTFTVISDPNVAQKRDQPVVVQDLFYMASRPNLIIQGQPHRVETSVYTPVLLPVDDFREQVKTVQAVIWVKDKIKFGCVIATHGVGDEEPHLSEWHAVSQL